MENSAAGGRRAGGRFGRQTEAERNDVLVLDAARAVFAEQGADAPVSAIAERAGVGMGTLYRRYGSKEQLLQRLCVTGITSTIAGLQRALEAEGTGWAALASYMAAAVDERAGAFAALAGTFSLPRELVDANERAKALAERLLRRGIDDRTVREDVTTLDITHVVEMFSRYPRRTEEDEHARRRMLAMTLDGLRAGHPPLPGPQPNWAAYDRIWEPSARS
ncbi:TetR/AcrR family transcriptional regulator [Streptomyces sp. NPDC091383]|uniref:TetR/AcrR family transcriptional regulator n=1 Tax=Streptomyces sp. NPDC091383 TaxID=3365996 RepID=UPI0011CE1EF2|nr:TetR/AcrR family transcriptional regulator [Streptomyces lavendulae]TXJ78759.1 TetR/AcrR family transcriptional regulator [Streptomyces lavendulae]